MLLSKDHTYIFLSIEILHARSVYCYLYINVYMEQYLMKKGHKFEREEVELYRRAWRKERGRINDTLYHQKTNEIIKNENEMACILTT